MNDGQGLVAGFESLGWSRSEATLLKRLIDHLLRLPDPSWAPTLFAGFSPLRDRLARAVLREGAEDVEERFLDLYAFLHMNDGLYGAEERHRLDATGGYWNHAGGLSPILKAAPWIGPDTVSADFGAGNGLQALLLQTLYPHRRTVQIEISSRLTEIGDMLREWLGVPRERIEWIVGDVVDAPATSYDFIYLYRPVRPDGPGRDFYARFASEVESEERPPVIFSVADCLREFLSARYEVFYGDGHLTCFKPRE